MNASSLLLRSASRRAATGMTGAAASSVRTAAVRSASVLSGSAYGAGVGVGAGAGEPTFQGSGFKAVGLRSLWSSSISSNSISGSSGLTGRTFSSTTRSLSFLADYDAHVTERAALADGLGVAPKPLDAAQVATLIDEIKGAKEGSSPDSDRVCFADIYNGCVGVVVLRRLWMCAFVAGWPKQNWVEQTAIVQGAETHINVRTWHARSKTACGETGRCICRSGRVRIRRRIWNKLEMERISFGYIMERFEMIEEH